MVLRRLSLLDGIYIHWDTFYALMHSISKNRRLVVSRNNEGKKREERYE
jgi:hypothetical protein